MSRQETRNGWSGNSRARAPMSDAMLSTWASHGGRRRVCEGEERAARVTMRSSSLARTAARAVLSRQRPPQFRSLAILPQAPLLSLTDQKKLLELRKAAELAARLKRKKASRRGSRRASTRCARCARCCARTR